MCLCMCAWPACSMSRGDFVLWLGACLLFFEAGLRPASFLITHVPLSVYWALMLHVEWGLCLVAGCLFTIY